MIVDEWFSTPIWCDVFNNISSDQYDEAIRYCKHLQTITPSRIKSNEGGWQSEDIRYENIINTPLQVYFDILHLNVNEAYQDLGVERKPTLGNIWININQPGDSNIIHFHSKASLSGVFYLTKINSNIIFTRNQDIPWFHLHNLQSNNNTKYSFNEVSYTPQQGLFIIFPSWLQHRVIPSQCDSDRISVAFNVQ
jgi:uncharacterized protein (TIGR02466 family)